MKQKTIFDILNDLTFNKVKWTDQSDSDLKAFNSYMVTRWLSQHPDYIDLIAECQPYINDLQPKQLYEFYLDILPKKKFFTKYTTSKVQSKYDELVDFFFEKFKLSKEETREYLEVIIDLNGEEPIKEELRLYGLNDKEIKKQFKL